MELPTDLLHTLHKHGGRIVRVSKISHTTDTAKDGYSRDYWFFVGDVKWDDGTESHDVEIAPYSVCFEGEENRQEVLALCLLLSEYLANNGDWHKTGRHKGWYARQR